MTIIHHISFWFTKVDFITTNTVVQRGATDWADLGERMHFIADLFRCYHESKELFETAFSAEQTEALKNGKLPGREIVKFFSFSRIFE